MKRSLKLLTVMLGVIMLTGCTHEVVKPSKRMGKMPIICENNEIKPETGVNDTGGTEVISTIVFGKKLDNPETQVIEPLTVTTADIVTLDDMQCNLNNVDNTVNQCSPEPNNKPYLLFSDNMYNIYGFRGYLIIDAVQLNNKYIFQPGDYTDCCEVNITIGSSVLINKLNVEKGTDNNYYLKVCQEDKNNIVCIRVTENNEIVLIAIQ